MKYLLMLDDIQICPKKKIEEKPTKELIDRFCDFANRSKAYSVGVYCNEPEKYYEFIESIVMQCNMLINNSTRGFHCFFTEDIMTDELVKKLEDLQERMVRSREDFHGERVLSGYIWCNYSRRENEGNGFLQRMIESKLKWVFRVNYNTSKNKCTFLANVTKSPNIHYCTSDSPLLMYEDKWCLVFPDGSIRFADNYQGCLMQYIEIGNIWTDEFLSDAVIKQRAEALYTYLEKHNLLHESKIRYCEDVCARFHVTKQGIYCEDELVEEF